jgi:hypothetical protein
LTEVTEDRVYARHARRRGAVLIVGAGAVGGLTAQQLAPMGISPLWLIDKDVLAEENIVRHPLGAQELGQSKATALAERIRRDFPLCDAVGRQADFMQLPAEEQLLYVSAADVVIAATDEVDCQRRVNQVCLQAERPAVFPAVWVDERLRDAEVGEIQWVLPGRHTPCYECAAAFRRGAADAQAARGARVDIELLALGTAQVVAAILDPSDERSAILDPERTAIYVHGLTPTSPAVRQTFATVGLGSRPIRVPFPARPCPACGGQEAPGPRSALEPRPQPRPVTPPPPVLATPGVGQFFLWRRLLQVIATLAVIVFVLVVGTVWTVHQLTSHPNSAAARTTPDNEPSPNSPSATPTVRASTQAAPATVAPAVSASSPQPTVVKPKPYTGFPRNLSLSCSYSPGGGDYLPCPTVGPNEIRLGPGLGNGENLTMRFTIHGLTWATWSKYSLNGDLDYAMLLIGPPHNTAANDYANGQPASPWSSKQLVYAEFPFGSAPIYGDFEVKIFHQNTGAIVRKLVMHAVR